MSDVHNSDKPDFESESRQSAPDLFARVGASDAVSNSTSNVSEETSQPAAQRRVPRTVSNLPSTGAGHGLMGAASRGQSKASGQSRRRAPRARRMGLSVTHVDPWSVAKVTFLLSVAAGIIQIVAVTLIWLLLNAVGVFDQIGQLLSTTGLDSGGFTLSNVLSLGTVLSATTVLSIGEVILVTLLAVIIAVLYNVISQLVGGVHMTVGDD